MKIFIAPDKFKGSLSAEEVYQANQNGIEKFNSTIETILYPLADGRRDIGHSRKIFKSREHGIRSKRSQKKGTINSESIDFSLKIAKLFV